MYLLGVLVAALGIGLSIALHEVGHLVPAKLFGVKVTKYMVGFGRTLWSTRRGETEYGIKAIPLGGYVNLVGMLPPRAGDRPGELRSSSAGRMAAFLDAARQNDMDQVAPGDEDRVFYKLPMWKKVVVMAGGPLVNLAIATVLITGIITIHGSPEPDGVRVASVVQCVRPASAGGDAARCTADDKPSPAAAAGLLPGDTFVSVGGRRVVSSADVAAAVRPSAGKELTVVVDRAGTQRTLRVTPIVNDLPRLDEDGRPVKRADGTVETVEVGYLGVANQTTTHTVRQPISAAPGVIGSQLVQTARVILDLPARMTAVARAAFGSGERDADSPMSVVGVGRVAGEVTSGRVAGLGGDATIATLVGLIGSLNIALFVFNMVPLPPLDGGHIAGAVFEGIKKGIARLRRRPDPGYVDVAKVLPLSLAMSVLLVSMSALLIYADIVRPVKIGG